MKPKKKLFLTIMAICITCATIISVVAVTYAVWTQNEHASMFVKTPTIDENPSLKYSLYVPLKVVSGVTEATKEQSKYERINGSHRIKKTEDTIEYSYNLTKSTDAESIQGFAFVGWIGGVSLEYIEIPDEVTIKIDGTDVTKPVVRIMSDSDFSEYLLIGNRTINKLKFGANIEEIDGGFFFGMEKLNECVFKESVSPLLIRDYAFAYCFNLNGYAFLNTRTLSEDTELSNVFQDNNA